MAVALLSYIGIVTEALFTGCQSRDVHCKDPAEAGLAGESPVSEELLEVLWLMVVLFTKPRQV